MNPVLADNCIALNVDELTCWEKAGSYSEGRDDLNRLSAKCLAFVMYNNTLTNGTASNPSPDAAASSSPFFALLSVAERLSTMF